MIPTLLIEALRAIPSMAAAPRPASFRPVGSKRSVLRFALSELHRAAPAPVDIIALPAGSAVRGRRIDAGGCTLCLSCVSACPTGALRDDPERPMLRFVEDACVQCGLCQATCPENVITLRPQIDFEAGRAAARILKEEEPFCCIRCSKPFGVKSTIERVVAKLEGKHWMYNGSSRRLDIIKMCDDCRVAVVAEEDFDPYGTRSRRPERPTIICVSGTCTTTTGPTSAELHSAYLQSCTPAIGPADQPGTTGNFSLCKAASVCGSTFRCACTSSGGVSASHWFSETSAW